MHCAISLVLIVQTAGQARSYEQNHDVAVVLLLVTRCALIAITTSTFWDQTKIQCYKSPFACVFHWWSKLSTLDSIRHAAMPGEPSTAGGSRPLSLEEYKRYGRQMIMPGWGLEGESAYTSRIMLTD